MCAVCVFIRSIGVAPVGLLSSHCLQIQSQVLSIANMNSKPVNRNIADSLEVQSEISEEISLSLLFAWNGILGMMLNCVTTNLCT